jgi:hypothetical protein
VCGKQLQKWQQPKISILNYTTTICSHFLCTFFCTLEVALFNAREFFPWFPISNVKTSLTVLDFYWRIACRSGCEECFEPKWNIWQTAAKECIDFKSLSACRDYWNERIIMGHKLLEALRQNARTDGKWCAHERNIGKSPPHWQKFLSKSQQSGLSVLIWLCQLLLLYYCVLRTPSLYLCHGCIMLPVYCELGASARLELLSRLFFLWIYSWPLESAQYLLMTLYLTFGRPPQTFSCSASSFTVCLLWVRTKLPWNAKKEISRTFWGYFLISLVACFYVQFSVDIGKRDTKELINL